ncbi:aldehyde dehydrogenase family protein [Marinicellulosiphila megalodicopiae]|uniref:aldehyde dehydrogenase family protein n=1 Tax=Marinicellulosiphila megalodicopiae TaxID=2724896 RepID=UPI003BB000AA
MNTVSVKNPFTQEIICECPLDDELIIKQKIDRCADAYKQPLTLKQKIEGLERWAQLLTQQKPLLAGLITQEQGKPLIEAIGEVDYALSYIEYYAQLIKDESFFEAKQTADSVWVSLRSMGVCAFITPWNFPIAMLVRKIAPAIAAGNTVIAKCSELTPLSAKAMVQLFDQAFNKSGLLELCVSDAALFSSIIMQDSRVRKISFTGSTRVGQLLIAQSAFDIKRLSLELGGDAPCIVSQFADIDLAVAGIMQAKFRNAGQTCVAINHLYVHESVEAELTAKLSEKIQQLVCGDGLDENTSIGPMIHAKAYEQTKQWVAQLMQSGAQILAVGQNAYDGTCFTPMLLKQNLYPDHNEHKEWFAPVLSMSSYSNLDKLIEHINQSKMGLAAYLFTENDAEIKKGARNIQVGMLAINTGVISNAYAPFGGIKHSGYGREGALEGIKEFMLVHYCTAH